MSPTHPRTPRIPRISHRSADLSSVARMDPGSVRLSSYRAMPRGAFPSEAHPVPTFQMGRVLVRTLFVLQTRFFR